MRTTDLPKVSHHVSIHQAVERKASPTPEQINRLLVKAKTISSDALDLPRPEPVWMQIYLGLLVSSEAFAIGAQITALGSSGSFGDHWFWPACKSVFIVLWLALFVVRFRRDGRSACCKGWYILDIILTVLDIFNVWCLGLAGATDKARVASFSLRRSLRILHLLRLMRLLSVVRLFAQLRSLSDGLWQSLRISGLVLVLLFLVLYTAGVYMTIIVGHTCDDDFPAWANCEAFFGTVWESMFTLFQVMTLDDWGMEIVRPVLAQKAWLIVPFVCFMMVTTFGLLNIIVGAVVENTLNAANELKLQQKRDEENQLRQDLEDIRKFFEMADQDGNGTVDLDEFKHIMHNRSFRTVLRKLALPVENPTWLFNVFDVEENGCVSIQDLTRGLFKFREHPGPSDMHTAIMQIHGLGTRIQHIEDMLQSLVTHVGCEITTKKQGTSSFCFSTTTSSPSVDRLSQTVADRLSQTIAEQWSVPNETQGSARRASSKRHTSPMGVSEERPKLSPRTPNPGGFDVDLLKTPLSAELLRHLKAQERKSKHFQMQLESIEQSVASSFDQMKKVQESIDMAILPAYGSHPQGTIVGRDITSHCDQRRVETCNTVQVNIGLAPSMSGPTSLPVSSAVPS